LVDVLTELDRKILLIGLRFWRLGPVKDLYMLKLWITTRVGRFWNQLTTWLL
jgi:hypothetical protein